LFGDACARRNPVRVIGFQKGVMDAPLASQEEWPIS